jgi:hypothetical protein
MSTKRGAVHNQCDNVIQLGSEKGPKHDLFLNMLSSERARCFFCRLFATNRGAVYNKGEDVIWLWVSETGSQRLQDLMPFPIHVT